MADEHRHDLLASPVRLPEDPADERLAAGDAPAEVAALFPASSAAWAALALDALRRSSHLDQGAGVHLHEAVAAYAYARTGYHRGLDALRRAGWKGNGPVPWAHEPNRGFLTALHALSQAAAAIGELDEAARCAQLLAASDPAAVTALA